MVYDAVNRLVYTVDGLGAVTQNLYDADSNLIETIAYANKIPTTTAATAAAIQAALARLRSGAAPAADAAERRAQILVNRFCLNCHLVGGVGGKDGPDLSAIGLKLGADQIETRVIDPKAVQADAMMLSLADKISADDIKRIAAWFAARK